MVPNQHPSILVCTHQPYHINISLYTLQNKNQKKKKIIKKRRRRKVWLQGVVGSLWPAPSLTEVTSGEFTPCDPPFPVLGGLRGDSLLLPPLHGLLFARGVTSHLDNPHQHKRR
jgi:hypothetical protein